MSGYFRSMNYYNYFNYVKSRDHVRAHVYICMAMDQVKAAIELLSSIGACESEGKDNL